MKALLLAGGLGTRLRPMTLTCPKPLLPIGNLPLIERIVLNLRAHGISEFVFLLHYQPESFLAALGDGRKYDAHFQHVVVEKDLSTAGSVKFVQEYVDDTTLIHSGDILAELPLRRMLAFHKRRQALATLALHPASAPLPFGLVLREKDGRIRRFFEKPTWPQVFSDWINASIYLIEPELLGHIPEGNRPVLFEREVFPPLAAANAAVFGFPLEGYWRDVGTPEDLRLANMDYLNGRLPKKMLTRDEYIWHIPPMDKSTSHYVVGFGSEIAPDAEIAAAVIGANSRIASHAKIRGAVLLDHVQIDKGAQVHDAILMRSVHVEMKAEIHQHALLAEGAHVGAAAIVAANAIVRNECAVAPGEIVAAKRVLPTGYIRRFVDGGSLLGSAKSGLSTDFVRWVGKTFALRQAHEFGKTAGAMENPVTLLLAIQEEERFDAWTRALAQGMLSAGCQVHLLESVTLPTARWVLQKERYAGGIYLGADRHAELLRLAFIHSTAEDFATEQTCSLERIDLIDTAEKGKLHPLEAEPIREDYLRMVLACACMTSGPQLALAGDSILNRPLPLRVGVVGQASELVVKNFFEMIACPAQVDVFPLDRSSVFRRHTRAAQKAFVQTLSPDVGIGIWIGGVGERIQLALPGYGILPRGRSDAVIAQLLIKQDPQIELIAGWLFPNLPQARLQLRHYEGCMLPADSLRLINSATRLVGLDGRGAIAFPLRRGSNFDQAVVSPDRCGIAYPDALMAMAFLLRTLSTTSRTAFEAIISGASLGYRLMPCPDESKAFLMRRLVEDFSHLECRFSDGIRLAEKTGDKPNWVIVRPCAGMPALEIYWEENRKEKAASALNVAIRRHLARWRSVR